MRILSRAFKVVRSFKAHDSGAITQMKQVKNTSLLLTVAEDLSNEPVLKVWALDKTEKKTGIPRCLSTLTVKNGRKQFPVRTTSRAIDGRLLTGTIDFGVRDTGKPVSACHRVC